jgi:hypothetical protein
MTIGNRTNTALLQEEDIMGHAVLNSLSGNGALE